MNQRAERLGADILAVLGDVIARGEIRDSRVRGAGIVTFTRVVVTGDLREACASFTVFGADAATLEQVRQGLESARSYLQQVLGRRLRARKTALLSFEVDRTMDHAFHIDGLLRSAAARDRAAEASGAGGVGGGQSEDAGRDTGEGSAQGQGDGDGDGDRHDDGSGK